MSLILGVWLDLPRLRGTRLHDVFQAYPYSAAVCIVGPPRRGAFTSEEGTLAGRFDLYDRRRRRLFGLSTRWDETDELPRSTPKNGPLIWRGVRQRLAESNANNASVAFHTVVMWMMRYPAPAGNISHEEIAE